MRTERLKWFCKRSVLVALSVFLLGFGWSMKAGAQEVTATINGIITDPAGKVVPNAAIVATDLDRGTVWPATSNGDGFYNLTLLPIGRYRVSVTAPGFRTAVQQEVLLQLNQVAAINVQLVLGQNNQTVTVTTEGSLLQTESTEVSTVIDARTNVDLPLATRNYVQLTLLAPGAVTPQPTGFTNGQTTGETSRPEINGNRFTANDYLLDGMDNNQMSDNFIGYAPQPDAIQEFNLISQNAPADFGNYMGGIISAAIKSGTNHFHGSVFEFYRNDVFNANNWANKLQTPFIARPKLRWNQFGAAIGGPIFRDKLFFFADYEGERFDIPTSGGNISVFSADERMGNVSELLALYPGIHDPSTGLPFVDNQIPTGELSPAALAIVNSTLYPSPINANLTNNAVNLQHSYTNGDQGDVKVDYAMDEKNHFMGRFSDTSTINPKVNSYNFGYNNFTINSAWNVVGGYTRTISPNMVNDARLGVNYVRIGQNHVSANFSGDAGTLFNIDGLPTSFLPAIAFGGNHQAGGVGNSSTVFGTKDSLNDYYDTAIQYQDVLNYTHGKHNFRFGFQGWRLRMNGFFPGGSGLAGSFNFDGQFSGSAETDFLLGLPSQVGVGTAGADWGQRGNIFGAFVQDDWKVSPKLTLNLGMRYEDHTPWYETHDRQVNFDPISGALELPGQNGQNRALYDNYNGIGNYAPRLGIAYLLTPKTTVRASYGLSAFMEGTGQGLRLPQNPPASKSVQADYRALEYPNSTLDQGFSTVVLPEQCTLQGMETASPACYSGALLLVWDHKVQPAHSNQWSFFVQRQLTPSSTVQIGYVGQQTRHLTTAENLSQLNAQPNGTLLPSSYFVGNPAVLAQGPTILATYSAANQNYNALQAEMQGRLSHGLSYMLSYTWSRCMTNAVGFFGEGGQSASQSAWWQNQYDPKADYGACYYNVKGDFTGYVIYDLALGRGRAFGANMNKAADAVVGGWRVSAIPTFRGGFPLSLGARNDETGSGSFAPRPDCNAAPRVLHKQRATGTLGYQWFDPTVYSEPLPGTFGNCSVSSVYGPGEQNVDLGLSKSFTTFHEQNLEFRAEFINAFNHVILDSPNNGIGGNLGITSSSEGPRNIQFALKYNF
jgi:Carboxypeptidase regulatory-like domain/TonB dependent receptor